MSNEAECDSCVVHMSNLATLQSKNAGLIDELDEVKSCPALKSELAENL